MRLACKDCKGVFFILGDFFNTVSVNKLSSLTEQMGDLKKSSVLQRQLA